jgi:acylphosphatase
METVEVMLEGTGTQTGVLLSWLATGSPFAVVTRVESNEETQLGETGPFVNTMALLRGGSCFPFRQPC